MPRLRWQIDVGNIIQIIVFIVTIAVGYGTLKADVNDVRENGSKPLREQIIRLTTAVETLNANVANLKEQLRQEREDRIREHDRTPR